jgi:gliding motility-associated-like protein
VEACLGLPTQFNENSTISSGSIAQWTWDFGDQGSSTQQNPSHTYASQNTYNVTLTVVSNLGCSDVFTATSSVIASPTASFLYSPSEPSIFNPTVNFYNTSSAGSISWNFGDGQTSSEENPIHTYSSSQGSYTVTLTIGSGTCSDTASATVVVQDNLIYYVPNTFTPDGDIFNQTFKPVFTSGFDPYNYSLMIFNRWGELIFESRNTQVGWDGTYNNRIAQEGVYTWRIQFKLLEGDDRREIFGTVLSIR